MIKLNDIYTMIDIIKKYKSSGFSTENKDIKNRINIIFDFIISLPNDYIEEFEKLENTTIRFCDYYDQNMLHNEEIIKYFEQNYGGQDKEKMTDVFALYVILKNVDELVYGCELCDCIDELYNLLDNNYYFEDILTMTTYLQEKKLAKEIENEIDFFSGDNEYQILFTGLMEDDVRKMEKSVKKAFIRKISGELSKSDSITLTEGVDHVRYAYDFPLFRIHFANDYRIAYIRKNRVTAILGATIKTGKDIDYTRYDKIAKEQTSVYREIEAFEKGILPLSHQHFKTVEMLSNFYNKEMKKQSPTLK